MRALAPAALLLGAVLWWMANVGFVTLGVLDGEPFGHGAWSEGFFSFPRWFQGAFAGTGAVLVPLAVVVLGGLISLRGARAWRWIAAALLVSTLLAVGLVALGTWIWPGDAS